MMPSGCSTSHRVDDKTVLIQCVYTCVYMRSLGYSEALFSILGLVFACPPQC